MKSVKISLFVCLLLCLSVNVFSTTNTKGIVERTNKMRIQTDPLSDDTTNPVGNHTTEIAEMDLEDDNDESNFGNINFTITPFIHFNFISSLLTTSFHSNSVLQQPQFLLRRTSQSYLNVFRI